MKRNKSFTFVSDEQRSFGWIVKINSYFDTSLMLREFAIQTFSEQGQGLLQAKVKQITVKAILSKRNKSHFFFRKAMRCMMNCGNEKTAKADV